MGLKLKTASNGSVSLEPTNTASDYTLTVPAQTGTVVATDASGNVGIGTSSPTNKLDVNGALRSIASSNASAGAGVEVDYGGAGTGIGRVLSYDRTGGTFKQLNIQGQPIVFVNGGSEAMRIDSSGRVTTPYQPAFRANRTSSFTTTASVAYEVVFNSGVFNIGSNYNTSTGRFTAPVAGSYYFTSALQPTSSGYNVQHYFYVNGSVVSYAGIGWASNPARGDLVNSIVLNLNAGDYVSIYVTTSNNMVYDNNGQFSGFLIG